MRKLLLFLLLVLLVLQFFRPSRNNISVVPSAANINNFASVPSDIDQMLKTSCYDCHSNNTVYPWYSAIQPVGWWLDDHIKEGKRELNFDVYGDYSLRKRFHKLEEIGEMVDEDEMPLSSYSLVHTNAKLSLEQKRQLLAWAERARADMQSKYPADSLAPKKK